MSIAQPTLVSNPEGRETKGGRRRAQLAGLGGDPGGGSPSLYGINQEKSYWDYSGEELWERSERSSDRRMREKGKKKPAPTLTHTGTRK